jgi:hypothetical protein
MHKAIKLVGLFVVTFVIFLIAGGLGLLCESMHNDLIVSTTTFLGSFGVMGSYVIHFYNSIA